MINWNLLEIVKAVNGKLVNAPTDKVFVQSVHHDSREIKDGSLFVPVIAERNGHDFVESAHQAGAVAAFWSDDLADAPKDIPLIVVKDTLHALKQFARQHLQNINPKVVGVTGSNGKTTTKDMTAKVLEAKYKTHKTAGNFNNEIGLPLTLLTMPEETEVVVLEMGTSSLGEIAILSDLAEPDVAIVTMIGESHIEHFGTRENLADEKMAILSGLKKDGLFIYPANESLIADRLDEDIRFKNFGEDKTADIFAFDISEEIEETHFTVQATESSQKAEVIIPIPGRYNVNNALIAILVGLEFGISLEESKKQLATLELTKNRLEWIDGVKGFRMLNDAYNASPTSMRAVLNYFEHIETTQDKIIVLGDILELGDLSQTLHEEIAEAIQLEAYQFVVLYGDAMKHLYTRLKKQENSEHVYYFSGDKTTLIQNIQNKASADSLILFKSSNGTDLLSVVAQLKKEK